MAASRQAVHAVSALLHVSHAVVEVGDAAEVGADVCRELCQVDVATPTAEVEPVRVGRGAAGRRRGLLRWRRRCRLSFRGRRLDRRSRGRRTTGWVGARRRRRAGRRCRRQGNRRARGCRGNNRSRRLLIRRRGPLVRRFRHEGAEYGETAEAGTHRPNHRDDRHQGEPAPTPGRARVRAGQWRNEWRLRKVVRHGLSVATSQSPPQPSIGRLSGANALSASPGT